MKALITGITGQDGSYLAELLLDKGYEVIGLKRRSATRNVANIETILSDDRLTLVDGDLTDYSSLFDVITSYKPNEIYNLAAQSHVGISFKEPGHTWDVTAKGCINLLEVVRYLSCEAYKPRFYQAGSSEMFGDAYDVRAIENPEFKEDLKYETHPDYFMKQKYQDEKTLFSPQSPYAVAKVAAHNMVRLYRQAYGIHASNGILFNHESPRRGENFVTRKVTRYVARLTLGLEPNKLKLGNLEAKRDWGFAGDYVEAMYLMLQQPAGDDYVISTGETHSVRELCDAAFKCVGLNYEDYVTTDPKFLRPAEVPHLLGDSTKARTILGWKPTYTFSSLVELIVKADIEHEKRIAGK